MCTSPINLRLCNTGARLFGLVSVILRDGNWNFFSSVVITGCYCNWCKMLLKIISGIIIFLLELFLYVTFVKALYKIQGDLLCNVIFKFKKEKEKVITGSAWPCLWVLTRSWQFFFFWKFHRVVYQLKSFYFYYFSYMKDAYYFNLTIILLYKLYHFDIRVL